MVRFPVLRTLPACGPQQSRGGLSKGMPVKVFAGSLGVLLGTLAATAAVVIGQPADVGLPSVLPSQWLSWLQVLGLAS